MLLEVLFMPAFQWMPALLTACLLRSRIPSRACPGLLSVMLHIEDTVPVSQSWGSQKCFCKLQRLQYSLSIFFNEM